MPVQLIANRRLNVFTLIAMRTSAASIYRTVATLASGLFPAKFQGPGDAGAVYFEDGSVTNLLVLPDKERAVVQRSRRTGRVLAMGGDGVNFARAFTATDVIIATGTGTYVAMDSHGVTLLKGGRIRILLSPIITAAMVLLSASVIGNALRLRSRRL